jgi:hypothetical protein
MGPFGYEAVGEWTEDSSISAVTTLTPPQADCDAVHIYVEDQSIRLTYDGTSEPSASTGALYAAGQHVVVPCTVAKPVQVIEVSASAKIGYQFLRKVRDV